MQIKSKAFAIFILTLSLLFAGCTSKQVSAPAPTPTTNLIPSQARLSIQKYPGNFTCFKFTTAQGTVVITDPYLMNEDVQPDLVTISHGDGDHGDLSRLGGKYRLIKTLGTFAEKGVNVIGIPGHHNRDDVTITNIIYVFEMDGLRLAQFASQGEMPTDAMFAQIGPVDILIVQIYGTANAKLSTEDAALIAKRLQAKIVIPAHTDTSQNSPLAALLGVPAEKIAAGQLIVTKADLAGQPAPRVVVLDVP
jgi:hypothetical protein